MRRRVRRRISLGIVFGLVVLAAAAGLGYVGPAFIYSIRDNDSSNRGDREANFGALLTTDWQPKFTASVLAR